MKSSDIIIKLMEFEVKESKIIDFYLFPKLKEKTFELLTKENNLKRIELINKKLEMYEKMQKIIEIEHIENNKLKVITINNKNIYTTGLYTCKIDDEMLEYNLANLEKNAFSFENGNVKK